MLKRVVAAAVVFAVVAAGAVFAGEPAAGRQGRRGDRAGRNQVRDRGWLLAVQLYTFNKFTFVEAIDKSKSLKLKYVEGFAWQKIGGSAGDAPLNHTAPAEALEVAKKKLQDAGIRMINYYVADFGKDKAEMRKVFEFAKQLGIEAFVCEPQPDVLGSVVELSREFRIRIAIHNHPKNPKDDKYVNWDPKQALESIKEYGPRIGCCVDTGHLMRSGIDPVGAIKTYGDRIVSLHLKDVDKKGPEGHDVPFGAGVADVKGQLKQLKEQNFTGVVAIEYEANMDNNVEDVAKCLDFIRKTAEELGQKVE